MVTSQELDKSFALLSAHIAQAVLHLLDLPPERCIMTGDRLETDVLLGLKAGMAATLTLTGAPSEADLAASSIRPTCVLHQLADLLPESDQRPGTNDRG
jgi:ribonucleotide monophosphatase NagD (HAD superfamily)